MAKKSKAKNTFSIGDVVKVKGVKSPRMFVIGSHVLKTFDATDAEMVDVQWFCLGKSLQSTSFRSNLLYKPKLWF